jgi:uncharacterized protein (TIGR02145 family)
MKRSADLAPVNEGESSLLTNTASPAALSINLNGISICHKTGNTYILISINPVALVFHLAHGDILPDADHDGYTKPNPLGFGTQNDCDDTNNAIHPGAAEVAGNGIDDDCNGQVDETTVTICNQVWMLQNLNVSKFKNGDDIPEVTDPIAWSNLTTPAWCWYNNNPGNSGYGRLYNWYAVTDPRGLAPEGWHVPTIDEWTTLKECLGGQDVAGSKMKETGTAHWVRPNSSATNSSGFSALPAGYRGIIYTNGRFFDKDSSTLYWCTSYFNEILGLNVAVTSDFDALYQNANEYQYGMAVRCVKD